MDLSDFGISFVSKPAVNGLTMIDIPPSTKELVIMNNSGFTIWYANGASLTKIPLPANDMVHVEKMQDRIRQLAIYPELGTIHPVGEILVYGFEIAGLCSYPSVCQGAAPTPVLKPTIYLLGSMVDMVGEFSISAFLSSDPEVSLDKVEWGVFYDPTLKLKYFSEFTPNGDNWITSELPHGTIYIAGRHVDDKNRKSSWSDPIQFGITNLNCTPEAPTIESIVEQPTGTYTVVWSEMSSPMSLYGTTDIEVVEGLNGTEDDPMLLMFSYRDADNQSSIVLTGIPGIKPHIRVRYHTLGGLTGPWCAYELINTIQPFTAPAITSTGLLEPIPTITSSTFTPSGAQRYIHLNSSWFLFKDPEALELVESNVESTDALTSWTISDAVFGGTYYAQVEYDAFLPRPEAPIITNLVDGATTDPLPVFECTEMSDLSQYNDTYRWTEWKLVNHLNDPVGGAITEINQWTVPQPLPSGTYQLMVRHRTTNGALGDWCVGVNFTV